MNSYVVYTRVSTSQQGRSGLGLEAQEAAVAAYLAGKEARVVATYTEVESGRRKDRPQLQAALETARRYGSALLVAKLDRLARDAAFLLSLQDSGIEFVAADMPAANRLTIGILGLVAEQEAAAAAARTRAALAARRARGLPLGNALNLRPGTAEQAASASRAAAVKARLHRVRVLPLAQALIEEGLSLSATAVRLNQDGVPTARGGRWTATSVRNLIQHH